MDQGLTREVGADAELRDGALNLLHNCVGLKAGQSLLLVCDPPGRSPYDPAVAEILAKVADRLGGWPRILTAPEVEGPETFPQNVALAMRAADHTVFLSRLGDQVRFCLLPGRGSKTMCCLYDETYLRADFARVPYGLFKEVEILLRQTLAEKQHCRVTCPKGTDLQGPLLPIGKDAGALAEDFALAYFPVMITPPLSAAGLSGRLALGRWLLSTSTHCYDDSLLELAQPIVAILREGRIAGFEGDAAEIARVERHFERVAARFGGEVYAVNSWHSGINPQTFYKGRAEEAVAVWSDKAYGSPRYTHFHACGKEPGDIAISLIDATISFDGEDFWNGGRLQFLERPEAQKILARYPGWEDAYAMRWDIGL